MIEAARRRAALGYWPRGRRGAAEPSTERPSRAAVDAAVDAALDGRRAEPGCTRQPPAARRRARAAPRRRRAAPAGRPPVVGSPRGRRRPTTIRVSAAAAAIELLHLMAIDPRRPHGRARRAARRPAPRHVALGRRPRPAAGAPSRSLAGDLAAVLADRELDGAGFPPERLVAARATLRRDADRHGCRAVPRPRRRRPRPAAEVASLKGGAYSVEGPLAIGRRSWRGADDALDRPRSRPSGGRSAPRSSSRDDLARRRRARRDAALDIAALARVRAGGRSRATRLPAEVAAALARSPPGSWRRDRGPRGPPADVPRPAALPGRHRPSRRRPLRRPAMVRVARGRGVGGDADRRHDVGARAPRAARGGR